MKRTRPLREPASGGGGSGDSPNENDIQLLDRVEDLNEEVRTLSLNLAIYLAKARAEKKTEILNRLEPDFIRLVNGTVKVVGELTIILRAARNAETMVYEVPSGRLISDRIETRLRAIVDQCTSILAALRPNPGDGAPR